MRILHVAESFGGGLMEAAIVTAVETSRRGHDVMIAHGVRPETPEDVPALVDSAVQVEQLPWGQRTPGTEVRASRELRRLVREWDPDLVHLHSSFAGVVGAMTLRGGPPTIFCPQGYASEVPEAGVARRRCYRAMERAVCRSVSMVGAVSHSEAELSRQYGARRVVRVPNGIPELDAQNVVTRPGGPDGPPTVIATGRTVP